MKTRTLPSGEKVAALGLGTWKMGERDQDRAQEIEAIRTALDQGISLIDTAEMYADGGAERVLGQALAQQPGVRDQAFVVSKVYPHNASMAGVIAACERSLKRLQTDRIDLYLLHWRGQHSLEETVQGFEALRRAGKIRYWGVSNFDTGDMRELWQVPGGSNAVVNQVLYNLSRRGIEWDLMPWHQNHQVLTMAYSPLEQSRLLSHRGLGQLAATWGMTASQVALSWLLNQPDVIAIPKSSRLQRIHEFVRASQRLLTEAEKLELDHLFTPPRSAKPLEML